MTAFPAYFGIAAIVAYCVQGALIAVPQPFRYAEGAPFHRLNRILYSPLCLGLGAGLAVLVVF